MENNKQNWEYYCEKYNLSLDNENYDDLERAFDEIENRAIKDERKRIGEIIKNHKTENGQWVLDDLLAKIRRL